LFSEKGPFPFPQSHFELLPFPFRDAHFEKNLVGGGSFPHQRTLCAAPGEPFGSFPLNRKWCRRHKGGCFFNQGGPTFPPFELRVMPPFSTTTPTAQVAFPPFLWEVRCRPQARGGNTFFFLFEDPVLRGTSPCQVYAGKGRCFFAAFPDHDIRRAARLCFHLSGLRAAFFLQSREACMLVRVFFSFSLQGSFFNVSVRHIPRFCLEILFSSRLV